jgi:hypothetical protein
MGSAQGHASDRYLGYQKKIDRNPQATTKFHQSIPFYSISLREREREREHFLVGEIWHTS